MCAILQLHQREHQEKVELLRELPYLAKVPRADLLKMVLPLASPLFEIVAFSYYIQGCMEGCMRDCIL